MKNEIALGARVTVHNHALPLQYHSVKEGVVVGELKSGMLLIDFGAGFKGHNGHGFHDVARGATSLPEETGYYVWPDHVREIPTPIASTAKAPQAKQQNDRILNHLLAGKSITQLEAFGVYRIFRLAARIHELKSKGHRITTTMHKDETGKPYAEYSLVSRKRVA